MENTHGKASLIHGTPRRCFEKRNMNEWYHISENEMLERVFALSHPLRFAIYTCVKWQGPLRVCELTQYVKKVTKTERSYIDKPGWKYFDTKLPYHLKKLEKAGLVGFIRAGKKGSAKFVYLKRDLYLYERLRRGPDPFELPKKPRDFEGPTIEKIRDIIFGAKALSSKPPLPEGDSPHLRRANANAK